MNKKPAILHDDNFVARTQTASHLYQSESLKAAVQDALYLLYETQDAQN
eukprot:CAMPEP_0197063974 /NCGR_PEP_ID=MMETSP1384-20130603/155932_1 /TAXON_ID=29189 /ORGANISM="Ammonia sp." /LENGTH=48 /DNA_ID= /DNA_START= /DNA_END= /DNA_ORIENTATION=